MKNGQIILVKFPFTNLASEKKRPCLVLSHTTLNAKVKLVTVAMITSRVDGLQIPGDVKISHWEEAGLLHPSLIRLSKIATIENDIIDKVLGQIANSDLKSIKSNFKKHFDFWL